MWLWLPDGKSGKCLDPEIQGAGLGKNVCAEGEQAKPSLARCAPLKG
jgi:hypothetical protein